MRREVLLSLVSVTALVAADLLPAGSAAAAAGGKLAIQEAPSGHQQLSGLVALSEPFIAGKTFATSERTWLELLFLDGTSIAVGPGSKFTVEEYAYNEGAGTVTLRVTLGQGTFRLTSGRLAGEPIHLTTGDTRIEVLDGAALVEVAADGTISAALLWGTRLVLTSGGETETVVRPGYETVAAAGEAPSNPKRLSAEALRQKTARLAPERGETVTVLALEAASGGEESETEGDEILTAAAEPEGDATSDKSVGEQPDRALLQSAKAPSPALQASPPAPLSFSFGDGFAATADQQQPVVRESGSLNDDKGFQPIVRSDSGSIEDSSAFRGARVFALRMKIDPEDSSALLVRPSDPIIRDRLYKDLRSNPAFDPETGVIIPPPDFYDASLNQLLHRSGSDLMLGLSDGFFPNDPNGEGQHGFNDGSRYFDIVVGNAGGHFGDDGLFHPDKPRTGHEAFSVPWVTQFGPQMGLSTAPGNGKFVAILDVVPSGGEGELNVQRPAFVVYDYIMSDGDHVQRAFVFGGLEFDRSGTAVSQELPGTKGAFSVTRYGLSDGLNGFSAIHRFEFAEDGIYRRENGLLVPSGESGSRLEEQFAAAPERFGAGAAFRRKETFVWNKPQGDTELLIASRPSDKPGAENVFLRADLQITASGQSNVSLTTGNVAPLGNDGEGALALRGRMVGSTRPATDAGATHLSSAIGSVGTSFDVDAPHLFGGNTFNTDDPGDDGRIGYFVLSQDDPGTGLGAFSEDEIEAGREDTPGGAVVEYAFARLATGFAQDEDIDIIDGFAARSTATEPVTFRGFATGIVESVDGASGNLRLLVLEGGTGPQAPGDVTITADPTTNRLTGTFTLQRRDLGTGQVNGTLSLRFGEGRTESAYIADNLYGARVYDHGGADAGFVVAPKALAEGIETDVTLCDCKHAQWGFWFGDVLVNGDRRDHLNLGYVVAGRQTAADAIRPDGVATYEGHVMGTVFSDGQLRDRVGSFRNEWDFGDRAGQVTVGFDGATYAGTVTAPGIEQRNLFSGVIAGDRQRVMSLDGSFFGAPNAAGTPPEMGGAFSITGNAGETYRANGAFAAKAQ